MKTRKRDGKRDRGQAEHVAASRRPAPAPGANSAASTVPELPAPGDAERHALMLRRIPSGGERQGDGEGGAGEAEHHAHKQRARRSCGCPSNQAVRSPAITTICAPMPTRLARKRSTSTPSTTRKSAPARTGIATIRPFCAGSRCRSAGDRDAERAEQHPDHEAEVEIEEGGKQGRQVPGLEEALAHRLLHPGHLCRGALGPGRGAVAPPDKIGSVSAPI